MDTDRFDNEIILGLPPHYESQEEKNKCPNCGRKINRRVKKCVCGMEFED